LTIATLLAGVLVAGLMLPYSLGLGLASNKITNALASTPANSLNGAVPETSTVTDSTGAPIAYLYNQNRTVVPLSAISENLQVAIVAVEDRRFVQHKGVDWRGTTRALLSNAQGDAGQQGGSTITQQYVKNYLFLVQAQTDAQRADAIASTPGRKLREAKLALTLEQHETKDDILAGYLNLVAFLPSTYGAEATAERLFGIHAADLDLPQAALMAGMVNNPNKYDPLDKDHVTDAKVRRDIVLNILYKDGSITKSQRDKAIATPVDVSNGTKIASGCVPARNSAINGYFCQYVLDYLANAGLTSEAIANGGYTITTTLDPAQMAKAHQATLDQVPLTSANKRIANVMALVAPGTPRKVVALTANRPYGLDSSKGQTVQKLTTTFAPLGAGSTFKIFTAAAAMQAGLGTSSIIQTPPVYQSPLSPHAFHNDTDNGETFPPTMTLQQALATSPNTGFVKLEDDLGLATVVNMSVAMGMKGYTLPAGDVDPAFTDSTNTYAQELVADKVVSFTLGVTPVSPLELANVGATVASDGVWCPPTPVNNVVDRDGKVVSLKPAAACTYIVAGQQQASQDLSRTLAQAMGDDITTGAGTANQAAKAANWNLTPGTSAGKTGTTGDYKSSAYVGFTPLFSAATVTWDYLTKPQSICMYPPNAPATATTKPLQLTGTCPLAVAKSSEGSKTSKNTGMTGGSVPAATWFDGMNKIQPNAIVFPPSVATYVSGQPDTVVPNLVGLGVDEAKATVAAKGFKFNYQIDNQPNSAQANFVTRQDPAAGQSALPGTAINVFVSAGSSTSGG
jgi:membrane peptidoglycan carboxypeptidase